MDNNGEYIPGTFMPKKVQTVKPEAGFLSYSMLLEQIDEIKAAEVIKAAALINIKEPEYETKKLDELVEQACKYVREV
jgi:isocitrate/isopropylmalate dehydrogenase